MKRREEFLFIFKELENIVTHSLDSICRVGMKLLLNHSLAKENLHMLPIHKIVFSDEFDTLIGDEQRRLDLKRLILS